jgi:hypothetical protein
MRLEWRVAREDVARLRAELAEAKRHAAGQHRAAEKARAERDHERETCLRGEREKELARERDDARTELATAREALERIKAARVHAAAPLTAEAMAKIADAALAGPPPTPEGERQREPSRSEQRRKALMRGEPMPVFPATAPPSTEGGEK